MENTCNNCKFKSIRIGTDIFDHEVLSYSFHMVCFKLPFRLKKLVRVHNLSWGESIIIHKKDSCDWCISGTQAIFLLPKNCNDCNQKQYCDGNCLFFWSPPKKIVRKKISEMLKERQMTIEELIQINKQDKANANKQGIYCDSKVILLNKQDVIALKKEEEALYSLSQKNVKTTGQLALILGVTKNQVPGICSNLKAGKRVVNGWVLTKEELENLKAFKQV